MDGIGELKTGTAIIGVDPGLNITGYGLVRVTDGAPQLIEGGVVRPASRKPLEHRLKEIFDGIKEVVEIHGPLAIAVEELYSHYKMPRTAILMGHARGAICLAAAEFGVPVFHYASTQVKKILTGNGRAPKLQVQQSICSEFGLDEVPEPADVADALAIALCHYYLYRNAQLDNAC